MDEPALLRKRYQRVELIGRGGSASVYRGRDEALGRDVAIKMYPAALDDEIAVRQAAEVDMLATLSHHGLVTLFDAGIERSEHGPRVYLVMEFVQGSDLERLIAEDRPGRRAIAQLGYDLAEALQYLHSRGVLHRDVKPSNILVVDYRDENTRARAKLTDFGIAIGDAAAVGAIDGVTIGTAAYLSPEQVRGHAATAASDVYSLGLVLLECFTGRLAYPGDPVPSALARLATRPDIPAELPTAWRSLLSGMTESDPADRATTLEVLDALRDLVVRELQQGVVRTDEVAEQRPAPVVRFQPHQIPLEPGTALRRAARLASRGLSAAAAIVSLAPTSGPARAAAVGLEPDIDPAALIDPLAAAEQGWVFYAGVDFTTDLGESGTVCVLGREPRMLDEDEIELLDDLAALIAHDSALSALEDELAS